MIFDATSELLCGICKICETLTVFATVGPEAGVGGIREIQIFGGFVISTSLESESHSWKKINYIINYSVLNSCLSIYK